MSSIKLEAPFTAFRGMSKRWIHPLFSVIYILTKKKFAQFRKILYLCTKIEAEEGTKNFVL